jgi:putative transposase
MRIEYSGALYHVTARGNNRSVIFKDDSDKLILLDKLKSCKDIFNLSCHAYCIMDNHYHILIETPDANLSESIHRLNSLYAQYFNKRYDHAGHVFQGRFHAILVERESYLLELCRYIVLNPVRAGIVRHPADYRWSSFNTIMGNAGSGAFLTIDWTLAQFDSDPSIARKNYLDFVMDGISADSPMNNVHAGLVLGTGKFTESISKKSAMFLSDYRLSKEQRYLFRKPLASLFNEKEALTKKQRNKLIFEAYYRFGYSQKELSEFLELHWVTIGRIIKNVKMFKC